MEIRKVRYYDFLVGLPKEHPKEWIFQNLKIIALNPEMAIYARQMLRIGGNVKRDRKFNLGSDDDGKLYLAYMSVRKIIEYEISSTNGKTRLNFKKIGEYRLDKNLNIV